MNKILIIGKKSFLGSNLRKYLSKYFQVDCIDFEKAYKKKNSYFNNYSHILNTSIDTKYVTDKYSVKNDIDLKFIQKFKKINFIYVFFNSRKIYPNKFNISENEKLNPKDNYSKNKIITEKYLNYKYKKKILSLRISNIIGKRIFKKNRNAHQIFFDNFLKYQKNNKKIIVDNDYKDFLSIEQFSLIVRKLIKLKAVGIFNVSLSEKVKISELVLWLNKSFFKKIKFKKTKKDSFTLSNKKLLKRIKTNINKQQLKKFCQNLFK